VGAKERQEWALGSAFAGQTEGMFGDKVDLDSPWKEHISTLISHFVSAKDPQIRNAQARV